MAFSGLICSVLIEPIIIGVSCSNRSRLKKWHYLDLICSVHVVTMATGLSYSNRSCLKNWHFLDLVCAYKFEFCTKIRMHPAQSRFARPGGVHNKTLECGNHYNVSFITLHSKTVSPVHVQPLSGPHLDDQVEAYKV